VAPQVGGLSRIQNITDVLCEDRWIIGTDSTGGLHARDVSKVADIGGNKRHIARQSLFHTVRPAFRFRGAKNEIGGGGEERNVIVRQIVGHTQAEIAASRAGEVECLLGKRESFDRIAKAERVEEYPALIVI